MAWRPNENVIEAELVFGEDRVTGHINFYREGDAPLRVTIDLKESYWSRIPSDLKGRTVRIQNPNPADRNVVDLKRFDKEGSCMNGFEPVQKGQIGTLIVPRFPGQHGYIEWSSDVNGRVVIEHPFECFSVEPPVEV